MTDKELMTLAAKAAGYKLEWYSPEFGNDEPYKNGIYWNPLDDDGDALRLAVKLDMTVKAFPAGARVRFLNPSLDICEIEELSDSEIYTEEVRCSATRRAIVRAAAEVGKGMLSQDDFVLMFPEYN